MDDKLLIALAAFGALVALAAWLWYTSARSERRRTEALRSVAAGLGFEFDPAPDPARLADLRGKFLFSQGTRERVRNLMAGTNRGVGVLVFDYDYTLGSGHDERTYTQTVVRFLADGLDLPAFALRPETVWHKAGEKLGAADIDFASHPKFSGQYLLKGEDEAAVRGVFRDAALNYFDAHPGLSVEAAGPRVVVYRDDARAEPAAVQPFLEQGFEVLAVLRQNG